MAQFHKNDTAASHKYYVDLFQMKGIKIKPEKPKPTPTPTIEAKPTPQTVV